MPLGTEVGLSCGYVVLDGDPSPPQRVQPPILAHVCCGQTAGWIKVPLGTEVDRGPGDIVLDGDPDPPKGHNPLILGSSVVAKRLDGRRCHFVRRLASAQAILC